MSDSKSPRSRVAKHVEALPKSGIRDFFELVNSMDDVISLGIGEPDFVTPWSVREATIYALEKGHTSYTSNLGLRKLRDRCCAYIDELFGVSYNPESECIITVGVSEGLDIALRAILDPGDEVLYHEPCYVSYAPSIKMAHATPVPVVTSQENGFSLRAEDVKKSITPKTKALILNFPNNPTGGVYTEEDKKALAELVIENDLLVITDEIYSELSYGQEPESIAALPGMRERTLLLHGFSKAFAMTGYRIAYACGPSDLIDAMMNIHQYSMLCASVIAQEAAVEAIENCSDEKEEMRKEYEQRRNVITRELNDMGLTCCVPQGAFYVFPDITSTGLSSEEFARQLLEKQKVAVVPGNAFGDCGEGHVRCSYATGVNEIKIAMERIRAFINEL